MEKSLASFKDEQLLYISFNQDASCFVAGTEKGFKIFNTYPFALKYERILDGGIGIVEMLYKSCILALVGGGKNPKYTLNKVILWDDHQTKELQELKFTSAIKSIKLKKDKIIVVCDQRIFVYNTVTQKYLDPLDTYENSKGIIGINTDPNFTVLAVPDKTIGHIKVKHYEKNFEMIINAHENKISSISVNGDGTLVATASEDGTSISVFYIENTSLFEEYRRGKEKANINYICFDQSNHFMACCSNRGTIHVWSLKSCHTKIRDTIAQQNNNDNNIQSQNQINNDELADLPENPKNSFSFFTGGNDNAECSFARLKISDDKNSICGFGPDNTLIAISSFGKYYQTKINMKKGGDCSINCEENLIFRK